MTEAPRRGSPPSRACVRVSLYGERSLEPDGFVNRPHWYVALREGWRRNPADKGPPYRAEQLPGQPHAWVVRDRSGAVCWTRDTGHTTDTRRQVAEAAAATWNEQADKTLREMT